MRYNAFYIIRPTTALQSRLRGANLDVVVFLNRPLLWMKREGGITTWIEEEYLAQSKLLFLLDLWSDNVVGAGEDETLKTMLEELLGAPPFNESVFDRWWSIERFDGIDGNFDETEDRLRSSQLPLLARSTLPRVEAWLMQRGN